MLKGLRSDEADLANWLTLQGDFIRAKGRLPFARRTMFWPLLGVIGLSVFVFVEFAFQETNEPWRLSPIISIYSICFFLQTIQRLRRLRLKKIPTGLPLADSAVLIGSALRSHGYGVMWTAGKRVGIIRLETSVGFGKERHILLLVPDDGHVWITALDAKSPFTALNAPRPFSRLLKRLRADVSESLPHGVLPAGTT